MSLSKYLGYRSSLKAYLEMGNLTSDDNLDLNLCIISTTYCIIIISENQKLVRKGSLTNFNLKSIRKFLVNFQTRDYRVSTKSYIPSVIMCLNLNIFLFFLSIFLNLIFLFFFFFCFLFFFGQ